MSGPKRFLATCLPVALLIGACGQQEPGDAADEIAAGDEQGIATAPASMPRTPAPPGARVYFVSLSDGDTVQSPFSVEFGVEGMSIVAAGVDEPQSGHHHLLVDTGLPDTGMPIPSDAKHIHFGDGSTSTELELAPGEHTLQLLLGDHLHIPHDPPVTSEPITIIVE